MTDANTGGDQPLTNMGEDPGTIPEADRLGVPDHRAPGGGGRSAGGGPEGTTGRATPDQGTGAGEGADPAEDPSPS